MDFVTEPLRKECAGKGGAAFNVCTSDALVKKTLHQVIEIMAVVVCETTGMSPEESSVWHSSLPHDNSVGLVVHQ